MDAMALLCNMHADGPATIKLLRRAGFSTLPDVTRARPERLADLLGVSPAYARRFAREARLLGERMGENVLDIEECAEIEAAAAPNESMRVSADAPRESNRSNEGVLRVAIRSSDDATRESMEDSDSRVRAATDSSVRSAHAARPTERADRESSARARVLSPAGSLLRADLIDGLDSVWCDRLISQGVLTLETLVDAPGMKLAKRLGVPLTELMDLQLLAQRKLGEERVPAPSTILDPESDRRKPATEVEPSYVLFPRERRVAEIVDDLGPRESVTLDAEDTEFAEMHRVPVSTDGGEDVGGPFA
jgi:hypothetical protein